MPTPTIARRLTVAEAAKESRRHPVTLYRALEDGRLHGAQQVKGGRWYIRPECLEAYLDDVPCVHRSNVRSLDEQRRRAS